MGFVKLNGLVCEYDEEKMEKRDECINDEFGEEFYKDEINEKMDEKEFLFLLLFLFFFDSEFLKLYEFESEE